MDLKKNNQYQAYTLINKQPWGVVYSPWFVYGALIGFLIGAVLMGFVGWAYGTGAWSIDGLGQFAASGGGVGGFVGAGIGAALGGFIGAVIPLFSMARKTKRKH